MIKNQKKKIEKLFKLIERNIEIVITDSMILPKQWKNWNWAKGFIIEDNKIFGWVKKMQKIIKKKDKKDEYEKLMRVRLKEKREKKVRKIIEKNIVGYWKKLIEFFEEKESIELFYLEEKKKEAKWYDKNIWGFAMYRDKDYEFAIGQVSVELEFLRARIYNRKVSLGVKVKDGKLVKVKEKPKYLVDRKKEYFSKEFLDNDEEYRWELALHELIRVGKRFIKKEFIPVFDKYLILGILCNEKNVKLCKKELEKLWEVISNMEGIIKEEKQKYGSNCNYNYYKDYKEKEKFKEKKIKKKEIKKYIKKLWERNGYPAIKKKEKKNKKKIKKNVKMETYVSYEDYRKKMGIYYEFFSWSAPPVWWRLKRKELKYVGYIKKKEMERLTEYGYIYEFISESLYRYIEKNRIKRKKVGVKKN